MPLLNANRSEAAKLAHINYQKHASLANRSFLSLARLSTAEIKELIASAQAMKKNPHDYTDALKGKALALLFQKTSTRTRCSFERAAAELGATATYID
ncbi:MAG: hypothetical protein PHE27_05535, partial [Alphaproteobacteria bacterium]|nr:hypothetical protein [Alphaproteobacteria bacterium]